MAQTKKHWWEIVLDEVEKRIKQASKLRRVSHEDALYNIFQKIATDIEKEISILVSVLRAIGDIPKEQRPAVRAKIRQISWDINPTPAVRKTLQLYNK